MSLDAVELVIWISVDGDATAVPIPRANSNRVMSSHHAEPAEGC